LKLRIDEPDPISAFKIGKTDGWSSSLPIDAAFPVGNVYTESAHVFFPFIV
jgi:hypothetical protein